MQSMQLNSQIMKPARLLLIVFSCTLLFACANNDEQRTEIQNITEAYEQAKTSIARGNYRRGIQIFEAIQARYPFSDLSRQIQLELIYAYYKGGQQEQAVDAAETFMRENPIDPRVDYALYIQGLSFFEDDPGILERLFRKDTTNRPPKELERAYASFRRLVERFPASEYAPDAEQRMLYIKNRLADYENHVADYYLRRGAYVAALNRAKTALEQFNGAVGNARSLEIMAQAYAKLGMKDLAADAERVLAENYPNGSDDS
ncbi:MAG: outer membrane protein assembly factor BamD [Woeseiaceae bacterium]